MKRSDVRLLKIPSVLDERGRLSYLENWQDLPFEIKRIYFLSEIPFEKVRGCHAHKKLQQVFIAMHGSFEMKVDDGLGSQEIFHLNSKETAVFVGPGIWRELKAVTLGAVCLVLASEVFDPNDYWYDYNAFTENRVRESQPQNLPLQM